jgi:hypothetical protein
MISIPSYLLVYIFGQFKRLVHLRLTNERLFILPPPLSAYSPLYLYLLAMASSKGDKNPKPSKPPPSTSTTTNKGEKGEQNDDKKKKPQSKLSAPPFCNGSVFNHRLSDPPSLFLQRHSLDAIAHQSDFAGFVQVNPKHIALCDGRTQMDPYLIQAVELVLDATWCGEIMVERKQGVRYTADEARRFSSIWSEVGRAMFRQYFEFGFTAVCKVPDGTFGSIPEVLPIGQLDVYVRTTGLGKRAYVYRVKSSVTGGGQLDPISSLVRNSLTADGDGRGEGGGGRKETGIIPNVMTFAPNPPHIVTGDLQSLVMALLEEHEYTQRRIGTQIQAETWRAAPPWFAEDVKEKKQDVDQGTSMQYLGRDDVGPNTQSSRRSARQRREDEHTGGLLELGRRVGGMEKLQDILARAMKRDEECKTGRGVGDRVDVPIGCVVRSATMPEVPTDIIKGRLMEQSIVLNTFGIPSGMVQTETAGGRGAINPVAQRTWESKLRGYKQRGIMWLYDLYHYIYDADRILTLHEELFPRIPTSMQLKEATEVTISLPGIPAEDKLEKLYTMGLLKWKAYKRMIGSIDWVHHSDLADDPDPPQVEYEPPPPPVAGPKAKSKPKSKAKKS